MKPSMKEILDFNLIDIISGFEAREDLGLSDAAKLLRISWIPPPSDLKRKREPCHAETSEVRRNTFVGVDLHDGFI